MEKEIQLSYKTADNDKARIEKLVNIIGEGIFHYLKKHGHLKKQVDQKKVTKIMDKTKSILESNRISNLMEL